MKKVIYSFSMAIMFTVGMLTSGCGGTDNGTEQHESHEHSSYMCPMDCEGGKTYKEPGTCPVCKMDLAEVENG